MWNFLNWEAVIGSEPQDWENIEALKLISSYDDHYREWEDPHIILWGRMEKWGEVGPGGQVEQESVT